jgi:hypothetical protein
MTKKPLQKKRKPYRKIAAHRGQWTADVAGQELAILHNTWRVGTTGYHDPMERATKEAAKHKRLTEALTANDVAVMKRDAGDDGLSRDGYIGLFSYKDLEIGDDGSITLTLVDRVQ